MLKRHLIFTVLILFTLGLAGCGSSGGSSSSSSSGSTGSTGSTGAAAAGGGVVNHPVANAEIYWDQADGTALQVGSSNSEAVVNIDISKLPDSGYPIVLYIPAGAGVIKGTAKAYNTKLSTVLKSKPANGDNIYFTMFTSMIVSAFEKSGLDPDAAVAFAESRVKGVLGAMGMTSVDPLTTNPLTNDDLQLAQMTLWKSSGMALTDEDASGNTDANIDLASVSEDAGSIIDNIANTLIDGTKSPVEALTDNISGMTDAASIISSVSSTAASEEAAITKKQSYGDTQSVAAIQAELTAKADAAAAAQATALIQGIGLFSVASDDQEWRIDIASGSGTVNKVFNFTAKNLKDASDGTELFGNGANPEATASVSAVSALGTSAGSATFDNSASGTISLTTGDRSTLTAGTYTLTFTLTVSGTSNTATVVVPVTVYNSNTQRVITGVTPNAVDSTATSNHVRLIEYDNTTGISTNRVNLSAAVTTAGDDSATYAVNFFPPSGTHFRINGQQIAGNYMKALSLSGADASDTVTINDVYFQGKVEGKLGGIKAEVYKVGAEGTVLASAYAKKASTNYVDFYGTTSAGALREMNLLINDGSTYTDRRELTPSSQGTSGAKKTGTAGLKGDVAGTNSLRLKFVTWAGDTAIDDVDTQSFSSSLVNSKYFKLFTDASLDPRGGFEVNSNYGNLEVGTGLTLTQDSGSNGYIDLVNGVDQITTAKIANYKAIWGYSGTGTNDKDSNRDTLTVKMYSTGGYTAGSADSVKSTGVILQYPNN